MKTSELIEKLEESLQYNGNIEVQGICDGELIEFVDINCPDDNAPLYLEFLKNCQ